MEPNTCPWPHGISRPEAAIRCRDFQRPLLISPSPLSDDATEPRLRKAPTGIGGFDAITRGGLPRGRPTLVTGGAGSGKTLFAMEFLVKGARDHGEAGVMLSFEESRQNILENMASLGFGLPALIEAGQILIEPCLIQPSEMVQAGSFDLDGLFLRLERAVERIGAQRVAIDTIELLLGAFSDDFTVRSELDRLFGWLKERQLTTVLTGERGRGDSLTRFGLEEYVSDCVVVLDHRVKNQISTRRLRVMKYRGSEHGTNEYPFLITERGFLVLPITSLGLEYKASNELVSSGVARLDHMLGGGIYRGSTVLISGSAGTGKTTLANYFLDAACRRGERALLMSFEESPAQLIRNMYSVGIDLQPWITAGLLRISCHRPTSFGLEEHLGRLEQQLEDHQPTVAVIDAMASVAHVGANDEVAAMVTREIDLLKSRQITFMFTTLIQPGKETSSAIGVSSLTDTWLELRNVEHDGERNRLLYVIKSRGMAHSNQVREFLLTDQGPELLDVEVGPQGVITGSGRQTEQARRAASIASRAADIERRRRTLASRRAAVQAQILALQSEIESETADFEAELQDEQQRQSALEADTAFVVQKREDRA
ncbi:circadian clock protein KaiC [Synechococcus sp. CS-1328]|uniref:circadian clock protein KaiC n=1 Tax=Synechococcus sp. CS-1328 TaxID=2847976 RepID=UPI0028808A39|nr:circadian clock protein KaiC [Synechococcus sp. CS-1328]MCT0226532.1 circadian clock protein KaiC [Synechococcus sp. CS-1328]